MLKRLKEALFVWVSAGYIMFVFKTSKIVKIGDEIMNTGEKFVVGFWHGDSYCYYPLLKDTGTYIVTTINKRGDYIAALGQRMGYEPIRVPDEASGMGGYIFEIKKMMKNKSKHIALTMDGPLGPLHHTKRFVMLTAMIAKKRILPVSIEVKRKIKFKNRWDQYMIPLPFNSITLYYNRPIEVIRSEFDKIGLEIASLMK